MNWYENKSQDVSRLFTYMSIRGINIFTTYTICSDNVIQVVIDPSSPYCFSIKDVLLLAHLYKYKVHQPGVQTAILLFDFYDVWADVMFQFFMYQNRKSR